MTWAGKRVQELWLTATRENVQDAIREAESLVPQLAPEELDFIEGLRNVAQAFELVPDAPRD